MAWPLVQPRRPPGKHPSPPSPFPLQPRPLGGVAGEGLASVQLLPFSWTPARKSRSAPGPQEGTSQDTAALVLVGCGPCSRTQGAEAGRRSGLPDPASGISSWLVASPISRGGSLPDRDRVLLWVPGQCPDQWTCDHMSRRDPLKLHIWRTVESPAFLVTPHLARRGLRHGTPSPMGCTGGPGGPRRGPVAPADQPC